MREVNVVRIARQLRLSAKSRLPERFFEARAGGEKFQLFVESPIEAAHDEAGRCAVVSENFSSALLHQPRPPVAWIRCCVRMMAENWAMMSSPSHASSRPQPVRRRKEFFHGCCHKATPAAR